ncbi:hypothetical protein V5799_011218 [Amblyomma americanum]|uniref:Carboxylesterase type B domain-containing protein n=1 Tax=Amblyomma americanum TaxID=6943 RepID=A0AAQ4EHX5_AMBAM
MGNSARANNGLLDQIAALHWIRDNIAEFGGDPANVTLAGHGTGAAMAHLLLLAPMAQSLVHRALLMSGSALSPWALARDAPAHARHVARALDCPVAEEEGLVECLRLRPVGDLLRVPLSVPDHLSAFGPTVDGIVLRGEPLELTESLASSGRRLELLMGVSRFESYFFVSASEEKYGIEADRRDRLLRTLVRNLFSFHQQEIFLTIVNEYTDWTRPFQGNESGAWPAEAASTARPLWEPLSGGGYSTALSVTIAVGCSLLVLNVLIFAGVYYQRDKTRLEAKLHKRSYKLAKPGEPPHLTTAGGKPLALRAPPPSPVGPAGGGGGGAANMAAGGNAATLPPKAPPLPEAQPLLAQGASLARLVLRTRPP